MHDEELLKRVNELLNYDPETGVFTWNINRNSQARAGVVAGHLDKKGYILIKVDRKLYKAHRLAWFLAYGTFPIYQIDHINCQKNDNRLVNLREATNSQNQYNQTARNGFKGVDFHKSSGKWRARIRSNSKDYSLGMFATEQAAYEAYCAAAKDLHGEFANTSSKMDCTGR